MKRLCSVSYFAGRDNCLFALLRIVFIATYGSREKVKDGSKRRSFLEEILIHHTPDKSYLQESKKIVRVIDVIRKA